MNWIGFAKGCAFGAAIVAAGGLVWVLMSVVGGAAVLAVAFVIFCGVMWSQFGAPWA